MTKILSRKTLIDTGFIKLYEDHVELKNKAKRTYNSGERVPAVTVFAIDESHNLYLIKEYRYLHKKILIEAVAGAIEKDESMSDAAKRELLEETGISANKIKKIGKTIAAGSFMTWDQHIYLATDLSFGKQNLEESEEIEVYKIPINDAVGKVVKGEINTATTAFGILLIDKLIKSGKI